MKKIATPQDLQAELRQLLAYTQSESPERGRIAATLNSLADRLETAKQAKSWTPEGRLMTLLGQLGEATTHLNYIAREAPHAAQDADKARRLVEQAEQVAGRDVARQMSLPGYRAAGSTKTAMDSEEEALYDALWMRASNDGDSYRKKDAKGAVKKAWMEWQKDESQRNRENWRGIQRKLEADLAKRWASGGV